MDTAADAVKGRCGNRPGGGG